MKRLITLILVLASCLGYSQTIIEAHEEKSTYCVVTVKKTQGDTAYRFLIDSLNVNDEYDNFTAMCASYTQGENIYNCVYQIDNPENLTFERILILTDGQNYIVNTLESNSTFPVKMSEHDYLIFKTLYDLIQSKL